MWKEKPNAIVEVIAKEVVHDILSCLKESQFFSIQIDSTTDVSVNQQCGVMLRFFDHIEGKVRYPFYALELVESAIAEGVFQ